MSIDYAEVLRLAKKGRKAEQRGAAAKGCFTALITAVALALLRGWMFMLALGIAHNHWWPAIPTIGYWWSVLLLVAVPFGGTTSSKKE